MPHITINTWPGKTQEQKEALAKKIRQAVAEEFGSSPGHVSVSLRECRPEDWPAFYRDEIYSHGSQLLIEPEAYAEPRFCVKPDRTEYMTPDGTVLAVVEYPAVDENTVEITHTEVDPSLSGQGIAGLLTERAVLYLRDQGKKIIPSCSYAAFWFENNKKYSDML